MLQRSRPDYALARVGRAEIKRSRCLPVFLAPNYLNARYLSPSVDCQSFQRGIGEVKEAAPLCSGSNIQDQRVSYRHLSAVHCGCYLRLLQRKDK